MPKLKARYVCQACGHVEPRWMGRCPDCSAWSSFLEEAAEPAKLTLRSDAAVPLCEVAADETARLATGIGELDRVLGGGLVPGSLTLLGGDPGIGKSTLLLQALDRLAEKAPVGGGAPSSSARRGGGLPPPVGSVLYVSGEESARQIALRAERLGAKSAQLLVLAETNLERILAQA